MKFRKIVPSGPNLALLLVLQLLTGNVLSVPLTNETESLEDAFDDLEETLTTDVSAELDSIEQAFYDTEAEALDVFRNETERFLESGNEFVKFRKDVENITLVVGMSGAGKTTITQIMVGDNKELVSYHNTGSGFLIKDKAKRILTDTIVSTSIFPELVIDPETGEALYDCPGFKDTRNASIEISSTRFMKKVADSYKGIKILVIVNHQSLRPGHTRYGYTDLLKHMLEFMNDLPKFQNSVAMVISKVDVGYSEQQVIEGAADFIRSSLPAIKKTTLANQWDAVKNLTRIFLRKRDGKYTNIGIFRQPTAAGPLSDLPAVQANRLKLRELTFNNPNFRHQETQPSDLKFVLSTEAKQVTARLVKILFKTSKEEVAKLSRDLLDSYEKKMSGIQSLEMKLTVSEEDSRKLDSLLSSLPSNRSRNSNGTLTTVLENISSILGITLDLKSVKMLEDNIETLLFLEETSNTLYRISKARKVTDEVIRGIKGLSTSIKSYSLWISASQELIKDVTQRPSDPNAVRQASKLNLTSGAIFTKEDLIKTELAVPILQKFLAALQTGEGEKFGLLKKLLTVIAWDRNGAGCEFDRSNKALRVVGHALASSQVIDCFQRHKAQEILHVVVISTLVFHLDVDFHGPEFTRHHGLNMILITPEVKALGSRFISLNGKGGTSYDVPATEGEVGKPGGHGGNGGKFYGVVGKFEGTILISANGGRGGKGQNGGRGVVGENVSADGKDGGAGGKGGFPGEVKFMLRLNKNLVKSLVSRGEEGIHGKGGPEGTQLKTVAGEKKKVVTPAKMIPGSTTDNGPNIPNSIAAAGGAAAAGAAVGAIGGPIGSAVGGVVGFVGGLLGGIFGSKSQTKLPDTHIPESVVYVDIPSTLKAERGNAGVVGRNTAGQAPHLNPANLTTLYSKTLVNYQRFAVNHVNNPFLVPTLPTFLRQVSALST